MKLMFASDIHGSQYYTQKLINSFKEEKAEKLILLGDILYHGPRNPLTKDYNPMGVASLLNEFKAEIISVRGNCDSEVDQMVLEFPITADYTQVVVDNFNFYLTHGHLYQPEDLPESENMIFVYGHVHIPILEKRHIIILNPGSISLPKAEFLPTYAIYENGSIQIKEFRNQIIKELDIT